MKIFYLYLLVIINLYYYFVFEGDSPLTEVGKFQARLTGEALGSESYRIHYCYSSPALRCIQTAQQILQGFYDLNNNLYLLE